MRAFLVVLFFLSSLSGSAWAGGIQGCYERQTLWWAYQIDGLNPVAEQTIGFQCPRRQMDMATGRCNAPSGWKRCIGTAGNGRCNYNEFNNFIAPPTPNARDWEVQTGGTLDTHATAKKCFDKYTSVTGTTSVYNYQPWDAMRDTTEYNDLIRKLGEVVKRKKLDSNATPYIQKFKEALDAVTNARVGDHGPFLIRAAQQSSIFTNAGMTIVRRDLGNNPGSGMRLETVDWARTAQDANLRDIRDYQKHIKDFMNDYYNPSTRAGSVAKGHLAVIRSFRSVQQSLQNC